GQHQLAEPPRHLNRQGQQLSDPREQVEQRQDKRPDRREQLRKEGERLLPQQREPLEHGGGLTYLPGAATPATQRPASRPPARPTGRPGPAAAPRYTARRR